MPSLVSQLPLLGKIALRNLLSHKVKSTIVGSIMASGTALMVIGTSLLDSVEDSMERVVTASLTGQLQVYSSQGRDELALFGGLTASLPEIGEIEDFGELRAALADVPEVEQVIPMGMTIAVGSRGNDIDALVALLREAVEEGDSGQLDAQAAQLRKIAASLDEELEARARISADLAGLERDRETLARVKEDAFWREFEQNPQEQLAWLDTQLAPLASDGRQFFLRLLGTDPTRFQQSFDRFKIEKGEMIPDGQRGVLLSRRAHERFLKHRVARQLDQIKQEMELDGKRISDNEALAGRARRLVRQYRLVTFQLDERELEALLPRLRAEFPDESGGIDQLIQRAITVTDETFDARYTFFYKEIVPYIELYQLNVGDVVPIQSFTRSGYVKSVNVKIWGTFIFEGIEDSDLAGLVNITDLVTFRELYGKMTDAQREELVTLRDEVGLEDVAREDAEDAFFGEGADLLGIPTLKDEVPAGVEPVEGESAEIEPVEGAQAAESEVGAQAAASTSFDEFEDVIVMERDARLDAAAQATYLPAELQSGLALNAAVLLKEPARLEAGRRAVEAAIKRADLPLRVVDWQEASGLVGQLIIVIRLVLYVAILIIFTVALVIINNSMVMATMDRVAEIGTMRAIGAQRAFVLALFIVETLTLGVVSGSAGALFGVVLIETAGAIGIPATNEIVRFIFAGPRLYPHVSASNVALAAGVIFLVSVASTLYPALIATRIQPVVAMRGRD